MRVAGVVAVVTFGLTACVDLEEDATTEAVSDLDLEPALYENAPPTPYPASLAVDGNGTCVVYTNGWMRCAGVVGSFQRSTPVAMDYVSGAIRGMYRAYLRSDGAVHSVAGEDSTPVTRIWKGATAVSSSINHACAIADGLLRCWGDNTRGQLGFADSTYNEPVTTVANVGAPAGLATPTYHTLVYKTTNSAVELVEALRPVRLTYVASIAASTSHQCGLASTNTTVKCSGRNDYGQIGVPVTTTDTSGTVSSLSGAVEVAVGDSFSCARLSSGTVRCWGRNTYGSLGNNSTAHSYVPVTALLPRPALQIAAAGLHACALLDDRSVWCWGGNYNRELGTGSTVIYSRSPQKTLF